MATKSEIRELGPNRFECRIGSQPVRFSGTCERAEAFFTSLAQRVDSRGLLCVQGTIHEVSLPDYRRR